jgi:hypothetical protein
VAFVTMPIPILEIGFSGGATTSTYLALNDADRGLLGTGTLAGGAVWTDVTAYATTAFTTKRGVSRLDGPLLRYEAGTGSAVLNNSDRRFDPTNLSGPYVAAGATQVTPMRAVRFRATWAGTTYDVLRGFADSWPITYQAPSYSETTLNYTDAFKVLASYDRTASAPVGAGEDSGARVTRVLNSVGWPATDRAVAVGNTTLQATTLSGTALAELQLVADTEIGDLYVDGAGRVVFRNRQALISDARSSTSQATFGDGGGAELPYTDVTPDYDDTQLANLVQAARVGGAVQTVQDTTSAAVYLTHTGPNRSDLLMQTDAAALSWAQYVLYQSTNPEYRFSQIVVNPLRSPATLYPQVLGREIGDRITLIRRPPGGGTITRDVFIRGIEHAVTPATWLTTWTLQSATKYAFLTLNNSTLGELDSNAIAF